MSEGGQTQGLPLRSTRMATYVPASTSRPPLGQLRAAGEESQTFSKRGHEELAQAPGRFNSGNLVVPLSRAAPQGQSQESHRPPLTGIATRAEWPFGRPPAPLQKQKRGLEAGILTVSRDHKPAAR